MALQHLDRKEDSPDKVYREAIEIKDSPDKDKYDKVHQQLMGWPEGPYAAKVRDRAYQR